MAADDFFTGMMSTARDDDELIEAVSFPCRARRAKASRSANSRGGMAISPSSPARLSRPRRPSGSRSAASRTVPVVRDFGADADLDDALA